MTNSGRHGVLPRRFALLIGVLVIELLSLSAKFDTFTLLGVHGFAQFFRDNLTIAVRGVVLFSFVSFLFGNSAARQRPHPLFALASESKISPPWLLAHFAFLLLVYVEALQLFSPNGKQRDLYAAGILIATAASVFSLLLALLAGRFWIALLKATKDTFIYAGFVASGALITEHLWPSWWRPVTNLTFLSVVTVLRLLGKAPIIDLTHRFSVTLKEFSVEVAMPCSGVEGITMFLTFSVAWLWFYRKECRYPQALSLLPLGLVAMWCTNVLRITSLLLIGAAGFPSIALGGFHSQAGWIGFIAVAIGFTLLFQNMSWVRTKEEAPETRRTQVTDPATLAFLAPLLAILVTAMLGRAFSASLDWFYPARVLAALIALWCFRTTYRKLNWSMGWIGAVGGLLGFGLWLALERILPSSGAAQAPPGNHLWIAIRVLGATVTVPLAEELAFRGFLLRRLQSVDFESIDLRRWSWVALLISSLVFGFMHGDRWGAGTLAGLLFAGAMLRTGSIGDAVLAHGVTNGLLAIWVLSTGEWQLW